VLINRNKWFYQSKGMIANWLLGLIHIKDIGIGNQPEKIMIVYDRQMRYPEYLHPVQRCLP
jgi:hypothetical protein